MKKIINLVFLSFITLTSVLSCNDIDDESSSLPIQNFIWKGLNQYYLYQPQVNDLNDAKSSNQKDYENYLANNPSPENFFTSLLYDKENTDKYSVLFSDYTQLEQLLQGSSKSNGVEYGLAYKSASSNEVFGYVKYIMPNSDASTKNIQRGSIFYAVNGIQLFQDRDNPSNNNTRQLLSNVTYTLNFADYDNGNITPNGQSVSLTKNQYTENPVLLKNVYTVGPKKVGYLVYNGFYSNFETELNSAFAYFKAENVTDFVLDLRYNSGGSIATATRLASMITGQFNGQLFAKQQWNSKLQSQLSNSNLINNFTNTLGNGVGINSINMSKVHVLTTRSTASASELIINCLKPYITVIQIGSTTTGKNVGSITLYDSPNYSKQNANPNHRYAMQPIVLKVLNKDNFGEYQAGITADASNVLNENLGNLGILGNTSELFLAKALNLISLNKQFQQNLNYKIFPEIIDNSTRNLDKEMYLEETPKGL
jgi:carboxyl-terminal processing protease